MASLFSLAGQTALVTGASRGLGRAIALALAEAGATVLCASSSANGSNDTVAAINSAGGKASALAADLSSEAAVEQLAAKALAQGPVHILVNCGGTIFRAPAHQFPMDEWHKVMAVNLDAAFLLSQRLGAEMIKRKQGKIINIASMLSYSGGITVPAYTASKHAIAGVTKALANEWAQHNIQVNAIAPGYFSTDNTAALQADTARNAAITARIPAGRWGEPEDLAGATVFLASNAANYVNGHVLAVDGGWLAR